MSTGDHAHLHRVFYPDDDAWKNGYGRWVSRLLQGGGELACLAEEE